MRKMRLSSRVLGDYRQGKQSKEYCDDCFKKDDLAKYKKEMDEYRKTKREEESQH